MLFLRSTARQMLRHLGMNLTVLFCLSVGAGLLGSLPLFAASTAERALKASLENAHPSVRNIKVEGPVPILNSALNGYINESIGNLVEERISIGNIKRGVHPAAPLLKSGEPVDVNLQELWIWSFDKLTQHTSLINGDWPVPTKPKSQVEAFKPPTIQTVVSAEIAAQMGLEIGDVLQDSFEYKYLITGIIKFNNQAEDVWWQDSSPIYLTVEPGINEDSVSLPIFINLQSMKQYFGGFAYEWRYILQTEEINSRNVEDIESGLINLKSRLSANRAKLTSGLPDLVQEFRENLSTARIVLYLLSTQAFLFVIFTLILMANLLVTSSHGELATMISRGASRYQIIWSYAVQILVLALLAGFLIGPMLASIGLKIWEWFSGDPANVSLSIDTWRMSLVASGIGWFAVVAAIIPATRSGVIDWQQSASRPRPTTAWQRWYIDIFFFIVGTLLFWQLSSSETFVMKRIQGSDYADPLLLIGPSILLIALAMLYLRLFPILLRGLTKLTKSGRGILLPLGLTRIARNPQRVSWIVLLISLASGLVLFSKVYSDALIVTQEQIAVYQAGSNLRLDGNQVPPAYIEEIAEVLPTSRVLRGRMQEKSGKGITILAVDPGTFVNVIEYPTGMTNLTIDVIMDALTQPISQVQLEEDANPYTETRKATQPIPAIFSYSALPVGGQIGDYHELLMAGQPITLEIRGIIADFPTLSSNYVIVNADLFKAVVGESVFIQLRNKEFWITADDQTHAQLVSFPTISNAALGDSQKTLNIIRNHIMTLGTVRAFGLNGLVLTIISLVGLLLANYFSFRQREYEFGILRAYGLSRSQSNLLLVSEGILVLVLGLISGILLGYSLTFMMRPYISLAVSRSLPGMTVHQIDINWMSIAIIVGLLLAMYVIAMSLIIIALRRSKIHQVLRTGDE